MAVLSHRKFVLLFLLVAAAGSHGQESSSRSSRREASDSESTFVVYKDRAAAGKAICEKTHSRLFEDYLEESDLGIWPDSPPELFLKPAISKSGGTSCF